MMHAFSQTNSPVHARLCPVKPTYEPGMKISYDRTSKRVIVAFRGRITVLPESYDSEENGIGAGESHCRRLGWTPQLHGKSERNTLRSLF